MQPKSKRSKIYLDSDKAFDLILADETMVSGLSFLEWIDDYFKGLDKKQNED